MWSNSVPECKGGGNFPFKTKVTAFAAITCPNPPPPLNGNMVAEKDNEDFYVGDTVLASCEKGFVIVGEPVIRYYRYIWIFSINFI